MSQVASAKEPVTVKELPREMLMLSNVVAEVSERVSTLCSTLQPILREPDPPRPEATEAAPAPPNPATALGTELRGLTEQLRSAMRTTSEVQTRLEL